MFCDKTFDLKKKKNWFVYYGKRLELSWFLFLVLSSDFSKHIVKYHSQVASMSSEPPFYVIQKLTQIISRPNCRTKICLFSPLSIFRRSVLVPYKASLSHVLLSVPNGSLSKSRKYCNTPLFANNFVANTFIFIDILADLSNFKPD